MGIKSLPLAHEAVVFLDLSIGPPGNMVDFRIEESEDLIHLLLRNTLFSPQGYNPLGF
jgi:hypothetical protein